MKQSNTIIGDGALTKCSVMLFLYSVATLFLGACGSATSEAGGQKGDKFVPPPREIMDGVYCLAGQEHAVHDVLIIQTVLTSEYGFERPLTAIHVRKNKKTGEAEVANYPGLERKGNTLFDRTGRIFAEFTHLKNDYYLQLCLHASPQKGQAATYINQYMAKVRIPEFIGESSIWTSYKDTVWAQLGKVSHKSLPSKRVLGELEGLYSAAYETDAHPMFAIKIIYVATSPQVPRRLSVVSIHYGHFPYEAAMRIERGLYHQGGILYHANGEKYAVCIRRANGDFLGLDDYAKQHLQPLGHIKNAPQEVLLP